MNKCIRVLKTLFTIFLCFILFYSCERDKIKPLNEDQKKFLSSQYQRSHNISYEPPSIRIPTVFSNTAFDIDSISKTILNLKDNISYPRIHFSDSSIFLSSNYGSSQDSLIFKYNFDGTLVKSFGRLGRGPNEFEKISDLKADSKYIYILDNNYLKLLELSSKKELKRLLFSEIYPQRLYLINEKVFLSTPFNSIFPFSVNIISLESSEIQNTLIDDREGPFKYRLANSISLTNTIDEVVYSRKGFNSLIFINKFNYEVNRVAEIMYDPLSLDNGLIGENHDEGKINEILSKISTIEEIHYFEEKLFIKIFEASRNKWLLGVINIASKSNEWKMNTYTLSSEFFFNNDKIWLYTNPIDSYESTKELNSIKLLKLNLADL